MNVSKSYRDTYIKRDSQRLRIDAVQETINTSLIFFILWFSKIIMVPLEQLLLFVFLLTRMIPAFKSFNNLNINIKSTYPAFKKIIDFEKKIKLDLNSKRISKRTEIDSVVLDEISFAYDKILFLINFHVALKMGRLQHYW